VKCLVVPMPTSDWSKLDVLETALLRGDQLVVDQELLDYLRKTAAELDMPFEDDRRSLESFVLEARRRIREGSRRLMRAIVLFDESIQQGRRDEARELFEEILRVETVPLYVEHARRYLKRLE
jgi:DUSAM domain-containing protein